MNISTFLAGVQQIADARPVYRTGGDGSDGTCDCVGLIMGALGGKKKFPIHSSNWFARYNTENLHAINQDECEPEVGDVVYKARNPNNPKYALDDKYITGRYDTGDRLDYYHIGTVTKLAPLEITHCTSTQSINGITYDDSVENWTHIGKIKNVDYDQEEAVQMAQYRAAVTASSGSTVRMRKRPDGTAPEVAKVPIGQKVDVLESADGWAKIRWNGKTGYMMAEFLRRMGAETAETEGEVTITIPKDAAKALYEALKGAAF